ncbi:hypothetical protein [Pseudomonas viridiflava]|uniref:hypothetical protein n=2 Tax=Pseudomonas viridiflava TaxID=33069 RepID=UPI001F14B524|nr:hypothetical protein [Pseudomonas viridiflava]
MMKLSRSISSATKALDVPVDDSKRKDKNIETSTTRSGSSGDQNNSVEKKGSRLDKATSVVNFASSVVNAGTKGYVAQQTLESGVQQPIRPKQDTLSYAPPGQGTEQSIADIGRAVAGHKSGPFAALVELFMKLCPAAAGPSDAVHAQARPLVAVNRHDTPPPPEKEYPGVVNADGSIIETEKDISDKPTEATGRPKGDTRTAEQIIDANPILKQLGNQKDIKRTEAYARIGDWTDKNTDPKSRADAAFSAAKVLNWINSSDQADGAARQCSGDSNLEGITHDGDARHGTEAGNWKDFVEKGYSALKGDHRLDKTSDSHVRADGSNKDNVQAFAGELGKKLWPLPGISNVLVAVGGSKGGLAGAVKAGAGAAIETSIAAAEGATDAIKRGRINPASVAFQAAAGAMSESQAAPDAVKTIAGLL